MCSCPPHLQCKLIVCQMSNTRCQPLSWLLVPMVLVVLLVICGMVQESETVLLYVCTAVVILAHIHYGVSVVSTHTHKYKNASSVNQLESYSGTEIGISLSLSHTRSVNFFTLHRKACVKC